MDLIASVIDLFLNLDKHLATAAVQYGVWIYAILFAVLFAETGLIVTPFLPGDSLLLTAGVLAGAGTLDLGVLLTVCLVAPILGDTTNYWVGRLLGERLCQHGKIVKREYVERTAHFFEKHGGKTVTIARFFPIVRTFSPFMAGVGQMHFPRFLAFSVGGSILWVGLFAGGGALFGQIPWVQENLEYGVMFILALSVIPAGYHYLQSRREKREKALELQ